MTDEQMDARLRAAGERWRNQNTTTAVVEPAALVGQPADIAAPPARRRRWSLIGSAAAVAAALIVGGVFLLRNTHDGPLPSGDTAALEGHVWLLQGVPGTHSTATLYIDRDGNLVADDECQLIGGKVAIDGNTMTVTDQVRRYKSCVDQYGPGYYEDGAAVLNGAATYTITPDALTIRNGGKELHFTLAPETAPAPTLNFPTLVGTDWLLASADGPDGNLTHPFGDPKLRIDDSGNLVATDGCNTLQGSVTLNGNRVVFGTIGGTERACAGDAQATETAVHAVLHGTATETVAGGELTIGNGAAELIYEWAPTSAATDPDQLRGTVRGSTWTLTENAGTDVPTGSKLSICAGLSQGCLGCQWGVSAGTMRLEPVQESGCAKLTSLQRLFGQNHPVVWSVYGGRLLLYLNDTQGSALVFDRYAPTSPLPTKPQLVGPTWHLTSITSGDGRYRNGAPPAEESTLVLTDSGFVERHVCYTQVGDYALDKSTITITDGHATDAHPCPFQPGRDQAANLVDSILKGTLDWSIDGDTLTLQRGDSTLVFSTSTTSTQNDPLTGTEWGLETAIDKDGTEHPASGQGLNIDNGTLGADDGGNKISASVQINDGTLTLSDVVSSAVGSTQDDPVGTTVDDVLQQGDVAYEITGDALTLTRGLEQLVYRASADSGGQSIVGTWDLTTIEHRTGPDSTATTASLDEPLNIDNARMIFGKCVGADVHVSAAQIAFTSDWITVTPTDCAVPSGDTGAFVFGHVLVGTCSYTIDGDQLTITKDGVGAIVLNRA